MTCQRGCGGSLEVEVRCWPLMRFQTFSTISGFSLCAWVAASPREEFWREIIILANSVGLLWPSQIFYGARKGRRVSAKYFWIWVWLLERKSPLVPLNSSVISSHYGPQTPYILLHLLTNSSSETFHFSCWQSKDLFCVSLLASF